VNVFPLAPPQASPPLVSSVVMMKSWSTSSHSTRCERETLGSSKVSTQPDVRSR